MSDFNLRICHLYPDLLNLYGDNGNVICLQKRLAWRGISSTVTGLSVGDTLHAQDFDLFFMGGGQDFEQSVLLKDAGENKRDAIKEAIEDDKVFLTICGGYQILGKYYKTQSGDHLEFMGCLDLYTESGEDRMIGNYLFVCDELVERGAAQPHIVGFENHAGKTFLGEGVKPLGKVLSGHGNNGQDGYEGAVYRNVYGTYSHGPVLPKNPDFCDLLLEKALVRKYGSIALEKLQDDYEREAHRVMEERLLRERR